MIKNYLWISFILFSSYAYSCDICGCAASSFSMGMLPNSRHHIIGFRSSSRFFESQQLHTSSTRKSNEIFSTYELFGRYKLNKRFQFMAFIPYTVNSKIDSSEQIKIHGIGDLTLFANYVFIDNTDSLTKKVKHNGTIGLGLKSPTGMYQKLNFFETNMLPGTGSYDFLVSLNYSLQWRTFGFQNESSFTYKTENKYLYRFGNAFSTTNVLFYRWTISQNLKIVPQIGLNFNHNWKDHKNREISEDTFNGGNILNSQFNIFFLIRNWAISSQLSIPIYQQLNKGFVTQKSAIRFSINYFITKK